MASGRFRPVSGCGSFLLLRLKQNRISCSLREKREQSLRYRVNDEVSGRFLRNCSGPRYPRLLEMVLHPARPSPIRTDKNQSARRRNSGAARDRPDIRSLRRATVPSAKRACLSMWPRGSGRARHRDGKTSAASVVHRRAKAARRIARGRKGGRRDSCGASSDPPSNLWATTMPLQKTS